MCTVHWSTHMPQVSYFYSMSLFFVMCLSDFILFIIDTSVLKTENTSFTVYTSALILFSPNLVPVLRAQWLIPSHAMVATLQLDQDTSTSYTWSLSLQQEMTKQDVSPAHLHLHQKKNQIKTTNNMGAVNSLLPLWHAMSPLIWNLQAQATTSLQVIFICSLLLQSSVFSQQFCYSGFHHLRMIHQVNLPQEE